MRFSRQQFIEMTVPRSITAIQVNSPSSIDTKSGEADANQLGLVLQFI